MKINAQKISRLLPAIGLAVFGAAHSAHAQPRSFPPAKSAVSSNIVFKERAVQVQITPTDFDSRSGLILVSGTGQIRLSGTLTTAGNNCCARVKAVIHRIVINSGGGSSLPSVTDGTSNTISFSEASNNSSVFKEQTFEICGSQSVNLSENLSAAQDDARFLVRLQNLDPWNKTNVGGTLAFRYPTADRILTGQPSIKFDLPQGIEANRAFKLSPNTPGKLKVKVVFRGNTRVRVTLKKPNGSNAAAPVDGASGVEFTYDIRDADITGGDTWTVNVLNLTDTPADDVDVQVVYGVEQ